jgi:hypothetical protein
MLFFLLNLLKLIKKYLIIFTKDIEKDARSLAWHRVHKNPGVEIPGSYGVYIIFYL